jgi:hypothetical protein
LSPELSLKKGDELGNEFIPVVEDSSRETRISLLKMDVHNVLTSLVLI